GRIHVGPAVAPRPDLAPGVGRDLSRLVKITADVAGRQTDSPAGSQEQVGEVLADAPAQPEGLPDGSPRRGDLLLVDQPRSNRGRQLPYDLRQGTSAPRQAREELVQRGTPPHQRTGLEILQGELRAEVFVLGLERDPGESGL